jgi:hypothetical protein
MDSAAVPADRGDNSWTEKEPGQWQPPRTQAYEKLNQAVRRGISHIEDQAIILLVLDLFEVAVGVLEVFDAMKCCPQQRPVTQVEETSDSNSVAYCPFERQVLLDQIAVHRSQAEEAIALSVAA